MEHLKSQRNIAVALQDYMCIICKAREQNFQVINEAITCCINNRWGIMLLEQLELHWEILEKAFNVPRSISWLEKSPCRTCKLCKQMQYLCANNGRTNTTPLFWTYKKRTDNLNMEWNKQSWWIEAPWGQLNGRTKTYWVNLAGIYTKQIVLGNGSH